MPPLQRHLLYELFHALDQPDFDQLLRIQRELDFIEAFAPRRATFFFLSLCPSTTCRAAEQLAAGWLSKASSLSIEVRLREPDAPAAVAPRFRRWEE